MKKINKAFTLVELIVVITILAILGTIAFISLQGYSKSSRDSVRISDVSNMKTSLELFHLNAGKYPLPDDDQQVTFSGNTLWYQGEFGDEVISQLSRNINKVPTDPLTDKKYIYSVANNKNEFEILALLESDLVLNSIEQTNAATITVTPRIDGTYNRVFIKTSTHIVPVPSIINSEVNGGTLILNENNIKSQVVSNGGNIPNHGNVNYSTGDLDGLVLSVYTGSLDKNSNDDNKEDAIEVIQGAYIGSELASDILYANILSKTETEDIVVLFNALVLGDSTIKTAPAVKSILNCSDTSLVMYGTLDGTDILLTCDDDIIVCNGTTGSGYVIQACNVGSINVTTSYNDLSSYGELFQWGNNSGLRTAGTSTSQIEVTLTGSTHDYNTFIHTFNDWNSVQNDNLWGNIPGTYIDRKGPCPNGYHVPDYTEWINLHSAGGWGNNGIDSGINMSNELKISMGGYRNYGGSPDLIQEGTHGYYWSSTPNGIDGGSSMYFYDTNITPSNGYFRSHGFSVRCFKN